MKRTLLVLAFLVSGCATVQPWWDGGDAGYPAPRFVTGMGAGDTCVDAEVAALGRVAAFFQAEVVSVERQMDQVTVHDDGLGPREVRELSADQFVRMRAKANFRTARILEHHTSPDGRCMALALLDREEEQAALERDAGPMRRKLADARLALEESGEPRIRARNIARALRVGEDLARLVARINLVKLKGPSVPVDLGEERAAWSELMEQAFPIGIQWNDQALAGALGQRLKEAGLALAPRVEEGAVLIQVQGPAFQPSAGDPGRFCFTWTLEASFVDARGNLLGSKSYMDRICHPEQSGAHTMVLLEVRNKALRDLAAGVRAWITMEDGPDS